MSLGPSNFEFFMDVGQGSITIDSVEATVVTGGASADSENASANLPTGPTSESRDNRTSQSPPDFIQNFMQVRIYSLGRVGLKFSDSILISWGFQK